MTNTLPVLDHGYAKAMTTILRQHLPNLMDLYDKYRRQQ